MWEDQFDNQTKLKNRHKISKPKQYRVIMHNDDYSTMDFVINVLVIVFKKSPDDATLIMLDIHKKGSGICGVYTKEIAETKIVQVHALAHESGFPLRCTMEQI